MGPDVLLNLEAHVLFALGHFLVKLINSVLGNDGTSGNMQQIPRDQTY